MEKIQNDGELLLRRVAVATGAGLLAVVAGLGMAPAGAADDVKAEAGAGVEAEVGARGFALNSRSFTVVSVGDAGAAEGIDRISFQSASFEREADIDTRGDKLSVEAQGSSAVEGNGVTFKVGDIKAQDGDLNITTKDKAGASLHYP